MKTTREKIILVITGIVVLYSVYAFMKSRGSARSTGASQVGVSKRESSDDLLKWLTSNQQTFSETAITPFEEHMVERAAGPWSPDPFLNVLLPREEKEKEEQAAALRLSQMSEEEAKKATALAAARELERQREEAERRRREQIEALVRQFVYAGYVSGGAERSVVVNGIAYKQGEILESYPFRILSISSTMVVLQATDGDMKLDIALEK